MIRVLGIKGSPRVKSNSNLMLDKVVEGIKDTSKEPDIKIISPTKMDISPCQGCYNCEESGECIFNDDMEELYQDFDQADIILISTPVFFNGVSAQLKTMIDRCQAIWSSKYRAKGSIIDRDKKRFGFLLGSGGAPAYEGQFKGIYKVIDMFFKVTNTEWRGELLISNSDEVPIKERSHVLEEAYGIGKELVCDFN
ncbi:MULTISPECIES: flavodoxin family protein [unclassified Candidatus Frackibacter]|uniref:flavodoxin family protein n=1 Tax=unclassified Candidatus Frackibacter TaxID=2648818 RepID=UPI00087E0977|nr:MULTISPECIES: flavodoxin family protein [unclassified Candidatus Frackibacter]SDC62192.1 NADPH-dependent FMN reductase [Candidatus Frackibacter sp. WG11]SEM75959.1 NADPH-dependent FMN reductase [Candidatus Frackibacter sp. WG12]SFL86431.1 NADPH-dependent FMN reductase [Candidatus Frackibacter sp. WG13]